MPCCIIRLFALVLSISITAAMLDGATAQDQSSSPILLRVFNNFAHDHATCAAYFVVASKCFEIDKDRETRDRLARVGGAVIERGQQWTAKAKIKPETFVARVEMSMKQMMEKIDNNCGNISLILNDNALFCKSLIEQPQKRIEALTDEALKQVPQQR